MIRVFAWPDGSWVFAENYEDYVDAWRGDDFEVLTFSDECTDEDIDRFCAQRNPHTCTFGINKP